jgi:acetoin utilization deacetylase AcuC-like enzyme
MRTGFHVHPRYTAHVAPAAHPERPERIERLLELAARAGELGVSVFDSDRTATDVELERIHTRAHVESVAATDGTSGAMLDADTYVCADSHRTARHAAGALLDLVDAVVDGDYRHGFAAVRPPGHHAEADRAMGFCLFNNVAVAARHLTDRHGLSRVLIVDWDVHHGNGTQHSFYEDPRVLFISTHRSPFYPGTGSVEETGVGEGEGLTVNVPLPYGCNDSDFLAVFDRVTTPIADRFQPEFVLVSAGFDAHVADPLGGMTVTEEGYAAMTRRVLSVAHRWSGGRCVAVLEGGYHLDALSDSVAVVLGAMASFDAPEAPDPAQPRGEVARILDRVVGVHRRRWGL